MYRSLSHLLTSAFTNAEQLLMGYSNTASIMRLGVESGASASTSPEDLSMQERLVQSVWVLEEVYAALKDERELAAICCQYGQGSTRYADGLVELAKHFDWVDHNILVVDGLLSNIYTRLPKMMRLSDQFDTERKTLYRKRDKIESQIRDWQYSAEDKLQRIFEFNGLIIKEVA